MAPDFDLKTWKGRYKTWQVEVFESERFEVWLTANDVRKVVPSLRNDAALQKHYRAGVERLDRSKRLFLSELVVSAELKQNGSRDALMFLTWYERAVAYPAGRKRGALPALPTFSETPTIDTNAAEVLIPDDAGLRLAPHKAQVGYEPPTMEVGTKKPDAVDWRKVQEKGVKPIFRVWRGEIDLMETFFIGGGLALLLDFSIGQFIELVGNTENYRGDHVFQEWVIAMSVLVSAVGPIWWCVGLMRCALRYQREHRNLAMAFFAFAGAVSFIAHSTTSTLAIGGEWLQGWFDDLTSKGEVVEVTHDQTLGRLVLRGPIGFGSYKVLEHALAIEPKLTLIQVESPGGYVIEGMAMAKLIQLNGLDTVSLEKCSSACTLLFAAGSERYLGPQARLGFHRSGIFGMKPTTGWTETEYRIANYYRSRGTTQDFIQLALDTASNRLWVPDHGVMLEAGYANKLWSERKSGY